MRSRRPSPEHQEAVSRRLAQLAEQLSGSREEAPAVGDEWWGEHTRVAALRPSLRVVTPAWDQPDPWPESDTSPGPGAGAAAPTVVPSPPHLPDEGAAPVVVPVPGRHAARRGPAGPVRSTWSSVLPETLRGRVALGPGPVAVVAVLVAVALGVTCWQVVRDDPSPPTAAPPVPAALGAPTGDDLVPVGAAPQPSATTGAAAPGAPGAAAGTVTVDVAGRVRRPGIVVLDAGSRVVDALEEAGGARASVDLTTLNLARPLVDGEQILVGVEGAAAPPPVAPGPGGSTAPGAPVALVDLNLADQAQLEALPDVGPVTAAAIVQWREEHGGFSAVTELLEVTGIGDATLATLTPLVTV